MPMETPWEADHDLAAQENLFPEYLEMVIQVKHGVFISVWIRMEQVNLDVKMKMISRKKRARQASAVVILFKTYYRLV